MRLQYAVLCGRHKKWRGAEVPVTNEAAAQRMRAIFATQLGPAVARLGLRPAQARMRAGLVATQMLGLALCRYALRLRPAAPPVPSTVDRVGSRTTYRRRGSRRPRRA